MKIRTSPLQPSNNVLLADSFRVDAIRFFDWCKHDLEQRPQTLDATVRRELESGKLSDQLLGVVSTAWSHHLKNSLPWTERSHAIRRALPNSKDYEMYMHCPMHQMEALPEKLHTAVAKEEQKRAHEIWAAFFANDGEERLKNYLRIWQTHKLAFENLIVQARGSRPKRGGGARIGKTEFDLERMV